MNSHIARILVVEQDSAVTALIIAALDMGGYEHASCPCNFTALFNLQTDHFDLILLDIGSGCPAGMELLEMLCGMGSPLVLLVDHNNDDGQMRGLQVGAAEIITKPFEPRDLIRRIDAVIARSHLQPKRLQYQDIEVDVTARQVRQNDKLLDLTAKEFDLLAVLLRNIGVALSRERILQQVWGYCIAGQTRTVDMHIMQLRRKIDFRQKLKTVAKVGYRLDQ